MSRDRTDDANERDGDERSRNRDGGLDRATLRSIATYQRGVLLCIAAYLIAVVVQFILPADLRPVIGLIVAVPAVLAATVFVFLLSIKVYSQGAGIILAVLTLVPCIGLIVLLVINAKATSILKGHGISVGLLGANLSDIE